MGDKMEVKDYSEIFALWDKNATPELDAEYKRQEDLAESI